MILQAGNEITFEFSGVEDLEGDDAFIQFLELKSKDQTIKGRSYPEWLTFNNATDVTKSNATVSIPEKTKQIDLLLVVVLSDDDKQDPKSNSYTVEIEVEAEEETEAFDPNALLV